MFVTHDSARYEMPKSVSGPYRKHWNSISFNINTYVFMITYVSGGELDSQIDNLMVASTELVSSCIADREDWDVTQLTLLEHDKKRTIGWRSHNITKLEAGKCENWVENEDEMFTDIIRMTVDSGDILYIEGDLVTKEPQEANFETVFNI